MKKLFAIIVLAAMFASLLSGCNGDGTADDSSPAGTGNSSVGDSDTGNNTTGTSNNDSDSNSMGVITNDDYIYIAEQIPLPQGIGELGNFAYFDGKVYFTASNTEYGNDENGNLSSTEIGIYSMEPDGMGLTELNAYCMPATPPIGVGGTTYIENIDIDGDGNIWVAEHWYFYRYNLPDNFDAENDEMWEYSQVVETGNIVRKLDGTGRETLRVDIGFLKGQSDFLSVRALAAGAYGADGAELIFIGCADNQGQTLTIYVLDSLGNLQFRVDTDSYFDEFIRAPGGALAFPALPDYAPAGQVQQLQTIDMTSKGLGEIKRLPDTGALTVRNGSDENSVIISDASNMYSYGFGDENALRLLSWHESNVVVKQIGDIMVLPDGRMLCTNVDYSTGLTAKVEMIMLTGILRSDLPEKTVLTLAVLFGQENIANDVAIFNATNFKYRIEVESYAGYSNESGWGEIDQLYTEMAAGKIPDIIYTNGLPLANLAAQGLLTNIYELIDADPMYSRGDFVEDAFRAVEIDGVLYEVFNSFWIDTLIGSAEVVGPDMGWNADEFIDVLDKHPEADRPLGWTMDKLGFLTWSLTSDLDEYIDWDEGTVSFDSPQFIQLLELSDRICEYSSWEDIPEGAGIPAEIAIQEGRQILTRGIVSDFKGLRDYRELFGSEVALKGIPTTNKDGNRLMNIMGGFAITEHSANKEGAWEFARTFLDRDGQINEDMFGNPGIFGFPTHQQALDRLIEYSLETGYARAFINGTPDPLPTREDLDEIRKDINTIIELIGSVGGANSRSIDTTLLDIIREDAADFFNGVKTAQRAARDIQQRASRYVAERST